MGNSKGAKPLTVAELEKAKALSALGKSYRQIGLELDRSDKTIKKALTKTPEVIAEVRELKEEIAAMYDDLAQRILKSISDETIKEARLRDRVISAGVCTDKSRLISGQSTANVALYTKVDLSLIELHEQEEV